MKRLLGLRGQVASAAEKASCEMTIYSSINTPDNKAQASGVCNGVVFGAYAANVDLFFIEGMANYPVDYSGQQFEIGIANSDKYSNAILTVYIVKVDEPTTDEGATTDSGTTTDTDSGSTDEHSIGESQVQNQHSKELTSPQFEEKDEQDSNIHVWVILSLISIDLLGTGFGVWYKFFWKSK